MIFLKKLNLYQTILKEMVPYLDHSLPNSQLERIYNDACIGLAEIFPPENGVFEFDDGTRYPVTDFAMSVISKKEATKLQAPPKKPPALQKKEENKRSLETDCGSPSESQDKSSVAKTEEKIFTKQAVSTLSGIGSQMIVSTHQLKMTNKKNPSDIREFTFKIFPLSVRDNATTTDIAAEVEHNGKRMFFVSSPNGQKSFQAEDDGLSFMIRGQWQNQKFISVIYPLQKKDYNIVDNESLVFPEELSAEVFSQSFVHTAGDDILYVLPKNKVNEPNGLTDVLIVQEKDGTRQIHTSADNVIFLYSAGIKFRIYAKWSPEKNFLVSIEQAE